MNNAVDADQLKQYNLGVGEDLIDLVQGDLNDEAMALVEAATDLYEGMVDRDIPALHAANAVNQIVGFNMLSHVTEPEEQDHG